MIDDESAGLYVQETGGDTVVSACGTTCAVPPDCSAHPQLCDSYLLRLASQPTATVQVALITDGQTDINMALAGSGITMQAIGGLQASQAFKGNITITPINGTTEQINRAAGSDLGSFLDEGFQKGQRIRLSGTLGAADGDYLVVDLGIGYLIVTPAPALSGHPAGTLGGCASATSTPGCSGVTISQLAYSGVYAGQVAVRLELRDAALHRRLHGHRQPRHARHRQLGCRTASRRNMRVRLEGAGGGDFVVTDVSDTTLTLGGSPVAGAHTGIIDKLNGALIRVDHSSWLDSGFLEGQLFKVDAFGSTLFKIQSITGSPGKTDVLLITDHPSLLPSDGTGLLTVTQWAAVATFTAPDKNNAPQTCPVATCGNWYQQLSVPIVADPYFILAPGRGNLRTFGKQPHLLGGIQGPLAVEGGTTAADRSLKGAVLLPGEDNLAGVPRRAAAARVAADRHAQRLRRR